MATLTLRATGGDDVTIEAAAGRSVMECAVREGVGGILADCGGQCQCATCHVYVPEQYAGRLPSMSADEDDMLEATACERTERSRLACQLILPVGLAELVVELPERQR
jgi:2Fe-2S ferredoxin